MIGWSRAGAAFAALAVILGAFAAHGLEKQFETSYENVPAKIVAGHPVPAAHKALQDFRTGAQYQFYHAIGLMLVGLYARGRSSRALTIAGWSFVVGIILFCGSLYLLTLLQQPKLGAVAPFGGTAFIVGWVALAIGIRDSRSVETASS